MGANDTLFPYAMSYMRYINIFLPVAVFSNYVAIFIRADNDPNRAMAGVLLGGVVNIALDIIFVFPMHMGMGGAAFASVLGMTIQVIVGGSHFFSRKTVFISSDRFTRFPVSVILLSVVSQVFQ